ncbi:hypothetical protein F4808DRAFT_469981 [Astrocystis sublimbata]|nr:hypothetical protein F4808DRAFT_469981 [Astrocystis sublimbata]
MFDVIWTDPNVERVGQRMLRKEQEAKEKEKKQTGSYRQSVSTTSSSSSERGFSLFASKSRWKTSTPSRVRSNQPTPKQDESGNERVKSHHTSIYGVKATLAIQDQSDKSPARSNGLFLPVQPPKSEDIIPPSPRDSVLSKWAHQAAVATGVLDKMVANDDAPDPKTESYIQKLGVSSFVVQNIETVVSPRTDADIDQLVIETQITSNAPRTQASSLTDISGNGILEADEEHEPLPPPYVCPQTPPPVAYRSHEALPSPRQQSYDRLANSEAWKPPHEWDVTPIKEAANTIAADECLQMSPAGRCENMAISPDFVALQREHRMMAAASPELMLANLTSSVGKSPDATVYKEFEISKKRWMFTVMHQQGGYAHLIGSKERPESPSSHKRRRILALYETPTTASFLAALYPAIPMTHLSPSPLSPDSFPSVQPLIVPSLSVSTGSRALAPRLYSAVTCLSMPALFPSTEIPPFLRHINRCLALGGALHLTIIDPQPVPTSLGPKLRQWLFTYLLINLEQAFRTTWPSKTFPTWLAHANLRGKGSTIATITAPAVSEGSCGLDVKTKLRCVTSRLLWQEVWGKFVGASSWWWDDGEIVQECVEMGTHWQYSHIIAVKGER